MGGNVGIYIYNYPTKSNECKDFCDVAIENNGS